MKLADALEEPAEGKEEAGDSFAALRQKFLKGSDAEARDAMTGMMALCSGEEEPEETNPSMKSMAGM